MLVPAVGLNMCVCYGNFSNLTRQVFRPRTLRVKFPTNVVVKRESSWTMTRMWLFFLLENRQSGFPFFLNIPRQIDTGEALSFFARTRVCMSAWVRIYGCDMFLCVWGGVYVSVRVCMWERERLGIPTCSSLLIKLHKEFMNLKLLSRMLQYTLKMKRTFL